MIAKHRAGDFVPSGIYLKRKSWDLTFVEEGGDYLPGGEGETCYYRIPVLMALLLGPLAGLAFILFLPVAVPVVLIYSGGKVLMRNIQLRYGVSKGVRTRPSH